MCLKVILKAGEYLPKHWESGLCPPSQLRGSEFKSSIVMLKWQDSKGERGNNHISTYGIITVFRYCHVEPDLPIYSL